MHRWLIDQDSSVSSEMPDGQGVWHYDDEVNICNTIPGSSFFSSICLFLYFYIYCVYISPFLYLSLKVCHYCSAVAVVVVAFYLYLSCFCCVLLMVIVVLVPFSSVAVVL